MLNRTKSSLMGTNLSGFMINNNINEMVKNICIYCDNFPMSDIIRFSILTFKNKKPTKQKQNN